MATDAEKRAKARYDSTTRQFFMRLRVASDADIISKLDSVENKTEYIRTLIRKDMHHEANA